MSHLIIMRHGDAEPSAVSDKGRPLSARGRSEVQRIGRALAAHLSIDKIVASPLVRAQETASLVAACFSHEIQRTRVRPIAQWDSDQVIAEYDGG